MPSISTPVTVSRLRLAVECIALFAITPVTLSLALPGAFLLPFLWVGAALCLAWLVRDQSFDRGALWRLRATAADWWRILLAAAVFAVLSTLAVRLFCPEKFFALPVQNTALWTAIMLLYTLFSVAPQAIVYRCFFFHRYAPLFPGPGTLVLAAAAAFAMAHVVFRNLPAVALSLAGGFLFARTYIASKSMPLSVLEHAIYGDWLFTVGLGLYFYHGR